MLQLLVSAEPFFNLDHNDVLFIAVNVLETRKLTSRIPIELMPSLKFLADSISVNEGA